MILAFGFLKSDNYYYYYYFFLIFLIILLSFFCITSKIKILMFILMCVHTHERDSSPGFVGV